MNFKIKSYTIYILMISILNIPLFSFAGPKKDSTRTAVIENAKERKEKIEELKTELAAVLEETQAELKAALEAAALEEKTEELKTELAAIIVEGARKDTVKEALEAALGAATIEGKIAALKAVLEAEIEAAA